MKRYRLIKTDYGVKKEVDERKDTDFDEYELEILPNWTSDLNGNPVAVLVKAEHIDDSAEEHELFKYESLWTNYLITADKHVFGAIDLLNTNKNIFIFLEFLEGEDIYINLVLNKNHSIKIKISRNYDGVIQFTLTPIMSYGPLDSLSKSFSIDLSKIASGEILLSKWSYFISKEQSVVTKPSNSTTSKSKDTKTVKTTKKSVKTSEFSGSESSDLNTSQNSKNQTNDTEQITETTTTETSSTVYDNEPSTYITYKYNINLTYGFDSYMFDNLSVYRDQLTIDGNIVEKERRHIHFYDVSKLDLGIISDKAEDIEKLLSILNSNLQPDHIESIPKEVISGGNHTIQYKLNTSECKLLPNKLYLAIINLETQIGDVVNPHYDYRYLYTNEIFNEYFNDNDDFKDLSIVIDPLLNIEYSLKMKTTYSTEENADCSIKYLNDRLLWINDKPGTSEYKFTFKALINNMPNNIEVYYNDMGFSSKYLLNLTKSTSESKKSDEFKLYYYGPINQEYNNAVILTESTFSFFDNAQYSTPSIPLTFEKDYKFKINYQTRQDNILIGAVKTNLLNTTNSVNLYKLYLSELNGLSNTMMMEPNSIFTVGIHNDGDDEDESWYGEGGAVTEGYTHTISSEYDDTLGFNESNELDTTMYSSEKPNNYYYYLKHSSDYLKLFGLEKDDVSETFYNYMNADDSPKELGKSLETTGLAPLLFVTSGYSADDANKDTTCVYAATEQFKAPSLPANGNVVTELDDEEEEKNNFNKEHPYWFIDWSAVNAFNLKSFMGTFMLKYATKYGSAKYTTTNNYFMMSPTINGTIGAFYLEDLKRSKEYNTQTFSKANDPKLVNYSWSPYLNSNIIEPYRHTPPTVSLTVTVTNGSYKFSGYSVGDLLATQLALFAVINEYTIPQETNTSVYCLSDDDKLNVINLDKELIIYKRIYSIPLNGTVFDKLNANFTFNDIKLSDLNLKLPSKNLTIGTFKENADLLYSELLVLNPLSSLIPDFNESVYMAEITPYGEVNLYPKQSSSLSNALYYWDDTKQSYEIYNSDSGTDLYKYGKFSKFTYVGASTELFTAEFNQLNYDILSEENGILEGFIKFHPLTDERNVDFLVKHRVSCPLNYNPRYGLYTNSTSNKESEMRFYFKESPHSSESNDSKRKLKDQIAYRSITKLAPPPHTAAFSDGVTLYVDPKHRV